MTDAVRPIRPSERRGEHLRKLVDVSRELQSFYRELGELLRAEHQGKINAWFASDDTTVTSRDRTASFATLDLSSDIITLKGQIQALEEERDLLRFLVKYES